VTNNQFEQKKIYQKLLHQILQLTSNNSQPTAILCGHFMLRWKNRMFSDHLEEFGVDDDIVNFSHETFKLGCQIVQKSKQFKLLVLVNDWQNAVVNNSNYDSKLTERVREHINNYYKRTNSIPGELLKYLDEFKLTDADIEKCEKNKWMFSEIDLRTKFSLDINEKFNNNPSLIKYIDSGQNITAINSTHDDIYDYVDADKPIPLLCDNTANCSGEIIRLLSELKERGFKRFINLYPKSCYSFVNTGTILADELSDGLGIEIINVAIPQLCQFESDSVKITQFDNGNI
jgi:hypothetical protein